MLLLFSVPLAGGVLALLGASHYGFAIYEAYLCSKNWHEATATIVKTTVARNCGSARGGGRGYSVSVVYTYGVEGRSYLSNRIWFGNGLCTDKTKAEETANGFQVGGHMFAYYNPDRPSQAVLVRGTVENGTVFGFFILLFIGGSCLGWPIKVWIGARTEQSQTESIDAYLMSQQQGASLRPKVDG
jgi:hypothetical protein